MGASTKTCMQLTPSDAAALMAEGAIVNGPFASQALCQGVCFSSANKWYCVSGKAVVKDCTNSPASGIDFIPDGVTEIAVEVTGAGFGFGNYGGVNLGGGGGGWARWNSVSVTPGLGYSYIIGHAGDPLMSGLTSLRFGTSRQYIVDGASSYHGNTGLTTLTGHPLPDLHYKGGDGGFIGSFAAMPCSQCITGSGGAGGAAASPLGPGADGQSGQLPFPTGGIGIGGAGSGGDGAYPWVPQDTARGIMTTSGGAITGISSITYGGSGYPLSQTIPVHVNSLNSGTAIGIVNVITDSSGSVVSFDSVVFDGTPFYSTPGVVFLIFHVNNDGHDGVVPGGGGGSGSSAIPGFGPIYRGLGGCGQIKIFLNPNDTEGIAIILGAGGDPAEQSQCLYLSDADANTLKDLAYNVLGPYDDPFTCEAACGDVYLSSSSKSSSSVSMSASSASSLSSPSSQSASSDSSLSSQSSLSSVSSLSLSSDSSFSSVSSLSSLSSQSASSASSLSSVSSQSASSASSLSSQSSQSASSASSPSSASSASSNSSNSSSSASSASSASSNSSSSSSSSSSSGDSAYLYDKFIDADNTLLTSHTMVVGSGWTVTNFSGLGSASDAKIVSNKATNVNTSTLSAAQATSQASHADAVGRATFSAVSASGVLAGLLARFSDTNNYFNLFISGTTFGLNKIVAGSSTTLQSTTVSAVTAGANYVFTLTCSGNNLTGSLVGTGINATLTTAVDSFNNSATKWGIYLFRSEPSNPQTNFSQFRVSSS